LFSLGYATSHFYEQLTPVQLAAMLIRLFGLYVLWVALDSATYFPPYWMRSEVAHSHAGISLRLETITKQDKIFRISSFGFLQVGVHFAEWQVCRFSAASFFTRSEP
jgi:hypothetical protein